MTDSETRVHFRVVKFIYESGLKLHLDSVPLATASIIYHKFFKENKLKDYDPFLIGATCLSLACKVEEKSSKLRDIVNVTYRTLHKSKAPLEIGEKYWNLRESIASCELYVLRALRFKVVFDHPHRYMAHYLKALGDWFEPRVWREVPIRRTAWAYLRDSYLGDMCLKYQPDHMAIAVVCFALQCHGLDVPGNKHAKTKWWQVFSQDITSQEIQDIILDLINVYGLETQVSSSTR